ncbi:MAG: hypothetical protein JWO67_1054 [Streptosporangiaceae bacterium]|nr:hypothetical protein [Streptosporangiaceae bacterium]
MTATQCPADRATVLRQVADMIRADHPAGCDDYDVWQHISGWLVCVAMDDGDLETAPRVRERASALGVAEAYLTGQKAGT